MRKLLIIVVSFIGITGVAWLLGADPLVVDNWSGHVSEVNGAIGPWRTGLIAGRWGLWCVLWWQWERAGKRLFNGESDLRVQWRKMRNRMIGGIAAVELLIVFSKFTGR
ncbi:MAG: hypothetical protein ACJAYC_002727 [Halieaceae bacterium]|jgi:hypothetical protein